LQAGRLVSRGLRRKHAQDGSEAADQANNYLVVVLTLARCRQKVSVPGEMLEVHNEFVQQVRGKRVMPPLKVSAQALISKRA
jgi:hypothetical protein